MESNSVEHRGAGKRNTPRNRRGCSKNYSRSRHEGDARETGTLRHRQQLHIYRRSVLFLTDRCCRVRELVILIRTRPQGANLAEVAEGAAATGPLSNPTPAVEPRRRESL